MDTGSSVFVSNFLYNCMKKSPKAKRRLTKRELEWQKKKEEHKAIIAKYGSLREWKKKEFFSMATLKYRGWNRNLVSQHLGNCDTTTTGGYRATNLWLKERVIAAEKLPAVKASITKNRLLQLSKTAWAAELQIQAELGKMASKDNKQS